VIFSAGVLYMIIPFAQIGKKSMEEHGMNRLLLGWEWSMWPDRPSCCQKRALGVARVRKVIDLCCHLNLSRISRTSVLTTGFIAATQLQLLLCRTPLTPAVQQLKSVEAPLAPTVNICSTCTICRPQIQLIVPLLRHNPYRTFTNPSPSSSDH
jgi:hypothetical protein